MLTAALTVLLGCQEPPPPAPAPVQSPVPVVADWNDKQAKEAIAAFKQATKGNAGLADRLRAVEALAQGRHEDLVPPLATTVQADKSLAVRRRAAEVLGQQPAKAANPVIVKLLKHGSVTSQPELQGDLVRGLGKAGYTPRQWREIDGLFDREYGEQRVVLQEAILDLVIQHKETQAIDMLLRNLDEPAPANVDDPSNPPAEYWEARWKSWRVWRTKVKDALFALTGQRFSTSAEAKEWLKKNPLR